MGSGWANHDLVFTKPDGTPLHPEHVSREFQRRIERINRDRQDDDKLTRIRLHDLRHTWATLAMQSVIPPKVVQERLGHSRISITLMGGGMIGGNVTPAAELNVYADAEDAAEAFRSRAPITMVGLKATHQVRMRQPWPWPWPWPRYP